MPRSRTRGAAQLQTWASRATVTGVRIRIATTAAAFVAGFTFGSARRRRARLQLVGPARPAASAAVEGHTSGRRAAKVRAVAVLATVRMRDAVGVRLGWRDGEAAADALVIELAGEAASVINARSLAG